MSQDVPEIHLQKGIFKLEEHVSFLTNGHSIRAPQETDHRVLSLSAQPLYEIKSILHILCLYF